MISRFAGFFFPRGGASGLAGFVEGGLRFESRRYCYHLRGFHHRTAALFAFPPSLLAAGINLAAEYPENPLGGLFEEAGIIMTKQHGFEVGQVRNTISRIGQLRSYLPDGTSRLR